MTHTVPTLHDSFVELRAEESRLRADLDELRRQVKSGETQLKQIQIALSVLDEKPRSRSVNHKPAATKQEVIAVMSDVLSANASLDGLQYALGDLKADATPSAQLKPRPKSALPPEKP